MNWYNYISNLLILFKLPSATDDSQIQRRFIKTICGAENLEKYGTVTRHILSANETDKPTLLAFADYCHSENSSQLC